MKNIILIIISLVALATQSCKKEVSQDYLNSRSRILSKEQPKGSFKYAYKIKGQDSSSKNPKTGEVRSEHALADAFSNNDYEIGSEASFDRTDSLVVTGYENKQK